VPETKQPEGTEAAILAAAVELIEESGSDLLRVQDVARFAEVGIPTIYYYFTNRTRLVAAAQAWRFRQIIEAGNPARDKTISAIDQADLEEYQQSVATSRNGLWSAETRELLWDLVEILADVRRDPEIRSQVGVVVEEALLPRVEAVKELQRLGWVTDAVDAKAWVMFYFGAVFGQVIIEISEKTPPEAQDFQRVLDFVHTLVSPVDGAADTSESETSKGKSSEH
jgi:AcrR family transcriptional regulator